MTLLTVRGLGPSMSPSAVPGAKLSGAKASSGLPGVGLSSGRDLLLSAPPTGRNSFRIRTCGVPLAWPAGLTSAAGDGTGCAGAGAGAVSVGAGDGDVCAGDRDGDGAVCASDGDAPPPASRHAAVSPMSLCLSKANLLTLFLSSNGRR